MKTQTVLDRASKHRFFIISNDTPYAKLLQAILASAFSATSCICNDNALKSIPTGNPAHQCLVLLDCLNCDGTAITEKLNAVLDLIPPPIKPVLYNVNDDREFEPLVSRHKIRGIFHRKDSQETFIRGLGVILNGQLWLSRTMLSRCAKRSLSHSPPYPGRTDAPLSSREKEVLHHVVSGKRNQEIADLLGITLNTVKTHLYNIYKKIHTQNRSQSSLWASTHLGANTPTE